MFLTLKIATHYFCLTLKLMMYHHTKFGCKRFRTSEYIVWTNMDLNLEVCCDCDLEHSNPIFSLDTLAYDDLPWK